MFSKNYTLGECRERILKLLERFSSNGNPNSCGEVEDIKNRFITCVNIHINKLWYEFSAEKRECDISFYRPKCIADTSPVKLGEGETFSKSISGRKTGYYLVLGGKGTVTVFCGESSAVYAVDTLPGAFTVIKGACGNNGEDVSNFVINANTYIHVKAFEVYEGVENDSNVYGLLYGKGKTAAFLPEDCSRILSLYNENGKDISRYADTDEKLRIMILPASVGERGSLEYIPYPPSFKEDASDSELLALSPVMYDALCYMCACDLCPADDGQLYSRLMYKYREILENIFDRHRSFGARNSFYRLIGRIGLIPRRQGR